MCIIKNKGAYAMTENISVTQEKENVLAGTVGALLFALAGGVVWFLLYQVGFMAGISGIVGVVCAIKGYSLFAKTESMKGIIISIIAAVVIMILAWYLCLSWDVYEAYQEWYAAGEVDFTLTFGESVQTAYLFLEEPDIAFDYLKDLGIGLLLCVVGAYGSVSNALRRIKQAKQAPVQDFSEAGASEAEEPAEQ